MASSISEHDGSSPVYVEARDRLRWYTVGLLKLGRTPRVETAESTGSGTLVQANGSYCILTAAHVAANLPKSGEIGILRFPRNPSQMQRLRLDMAHVVATVIGTALHEGWA